MSTGQFVNHISHLEGTTAIADDRIAKDFAPVKVYLPTSSSTNRVHNGLVFMEFRDKNYKAAFMALVAFGYVEGVPGNMERLPCPLQLDTVKDTFESLLDDCAAAASAIYPSDPSRFVFTSSAAAAPVSGPPASVPAAAAAAATTSSNSNCPTNSGSDPRIYRNSRHPAPNRAPSFRWDEIKNFHRLGLNNRAMDEDWNLTSRVAEAPGQSDFPWPRSSQSANLTAGWSPPHRRYPLPPQAAGGSLVGRGGSSGGYDAAWRSLTAQDQEDHGLSGSDMNKFLPAGPKKEEKQKNLLWPRGSAFRTSKEERRH